MPAYAFLNDRELDPKSIQKSMDVLSFPYTVDDIKALNGKTEMDAIVAYMQKLGTGIPKETTEVEIVGDLANPFPQDNAAISAGRDLYQQNCAACHGNELEGDIGPELDVDVYDDELLFELIYVGITDNGMPSFATLGSKKVWQLVNYINYRKEP
jgi:cytochrome c oxidase cbb3-type subunit 2